MHQPTTPAMSPRRLPAAVLALLAVGGLAVPIEAAAQDRYRTFSAYSNPYFRDTYRAPRRLEQRLRPKPAERRASPPEKAAASRSTAQPAGTAATEPLTIVVSIGSQRLTVFSGTEQIARASVSSGKRGHETPTGVFSVIQKERIHFSNLYDNAPMPFMQRLTWSGIALHAGHLPGHPASHGCVRMPHEFARKLFAMTAMGARVIVTSGDPAPTLLSHQRLAALTGPAPTQLASAGEVRLEPPMHLGLGTPQAGSESGAVSADAPSRSLLVRAQQAVAQRTLTLEAARMRLEQAARPLADASGLAQQAREAVAVGRGEVTRARTHLQRIETEIARTEARFKDLERTADRAHHSAAALEDRLEDTIERLTGELEPARTAVAEKEETAREIAEEAEQAEALRREAQRTHDAAATHVKRAEEELKEARRDLAKRQRPVSLLVSRKTGKLYVRQGFEPLIETQVSLDEPDAAVGTHVYTALPAGAGSPLRWSVVSVPSRGEAAAEPVPQRPLSRTTRLEPAARSSRVHPITASAALDRLQIPADVLAEIGDLIRPGSSLIITDEPLSRETGKATDLIVQTR